MSINWKSLVSFSAVAALLLTASPIGLTAKDARADLYGVWRTVEVTVPGPTPQIFRPAATLAIFHGKHYSRVEVHAEQARPIMKDPSVASADELRAVWGPFVGEAGTFEVTGTNTITMQASVAKNPAAMMNGATSVFKYQRQSDTLTLTQMRTHAGPSANPATIKLVRVE